MDIYLVYVVCALLLLVGVKYAGIKKFNDDYLSLDASKAIQGFAAIVIIFHHISQRVSQDGSIQTPINFFVNIGAYCVAIFFFCSGYGLIKSKDKKEGYMKSFLWKRLVVLLLPFFVINGFYVLVAQIFMKANFSPFTIFSYVVGLKLVTGDGWYVITSLIMYIAFFLFFRFINKKFEWIAFVGMFLMVPLYVVLCLSKGHGDGSNLFQGEWFYNTVLLMPIGMVWARLENKLVPLIKKVYWILLPVFGALTFFTYKWSMEVLSNPGYWSEYMHPGDPRYGDKLLCYGAQSLAFICFILFLVLLLMKVRINNKVLAFLGGLTLEIYLSQRFFISNILPMYNNKDGIFIGIFAIVCSSVVLAYLFHVLCGLVINPIKKLGSKKPAVDKTKKQFFHQSSK